MLREILNFLLHYYYFCHERDETEKKIGTSKDPLSFINKSISLPPEFSWKFCNYRGIILKYLYFQYVLVSLLDATHFKINFEYFPNLDNLLLTIISLSMKVRLCLRVYLNWIFVLTCFTWIECFFLSSIKVLYGDFLCKKDLLKQEKKF